jgi:hypothetical protein
MEQGGIHVVCSISAANLSNREADHSGINDSCEAACLAELKSADEGIQDQAALNDMMAEVPRNLKKIAGKSLPIEVSCHSSLVSNFFLKKSLYRNSYRENRENSHLSTIG